MRVFFFVDSFPKLSETFIVQQIVGLIEAGYEINIVADSLGSENEEQPLIKKYDLLSKVIIPVSKNFFARFFSALIFCFKNFKFVASYRFKSKYHIYTLLRLPYLSKLDIRNDDIVISNFGLNGIKAALLLRLGKKFKLLTIFHGYDMSAFLKLEPQNVYEDVFRYSSKILPCSKFWASKLAQMGCLPEKINVYHYGIDLDEFIPTEQTREKTFTLLSIGRFVEKKGFIFSINAYAEFLKNNKENSVYKIVGDGPLMEEFRELVDELGIGSHVQFLGSRNSSEVKKLLQYADVLLVPSVTAANGDMEGIPNVMLEAQAMMIPVIATKHSGLGEGLISGKSGVLVQERNVDELADAIKFLFQNPETCKQFGETGRAFINKEFSARKQRDMLVNIIKAL
jgi:colanic acid/amylovoran biosynthesis glycosyltransferase